MFLFDTNVLSELVRKRPEKGLLRRLADVPRSASFASEVTLFEMRFGAMLRDDAAVFWNRLEERILPAVEWLPMGRAVLLRGADLAADLQSKGAVIGNEDCWIAATAIEHRLILVTRNVRHFSRIPGLKIENWFD
jgi:tRNA(fMet)-specific endonuclease VapC